MKTQTKFHLKALLAIGVSAAVLTGCAQKELILDGLREDLRSPDYDVNDPAAVAAATAAAEKAGAVENLSRPVSLGRAQNIGAWTHRGYNAKHNLPHAAFTAAPSVIWRAKIGDGNTGRERIVAAPVSDGSRIFTVDSKGLLSATATSGAKVWSVNIRAAGERAGTGSGLALAGGKLFATTSNGSLVALDPASGKILWRQQVTGGISAAPTASGGKVYITSAASGAYAINAANGRIDWHLPGLPTQYGFAGAAAPAISGGDVVFAMANGSMVGVDARKGTPDWVARLPGDRAGRGKNVLQAFGGEPVVAGGLIFAATQAGRAFAVTPSGSVRWKADEGAAGMMAVAGGAVFFVNDENKLVRLSARDGKRLWIVDLPRYDTDNTRKQKSVYPAFGPLMAGGQLWVASGDGFLRSYNPADGAVTREVELPSGAAARPIIVGGTLYLVTTKGDLLALR